MGKEREYQVDTGFYLYKNVIKRILDISVSLVALIVLLIPFVIISLLIKLDSKGPVFFKQVRMGKNDIPFDILKFRSMYETAPHQISTSQLSNPSQHVTTIGKFLRKTSLDELPQLLNVIKGDMSIVGPRPLILSEKNVLDLRTRNGASRVLPGITGLAQVNGRDELPDDEKAKFDSYYAANISIGLDFKIIMKTFVDVLDERGIKE
ncbi:sugar transferase [Limosilactobacillus reuteri]|uniref:sugar transferase n=1 Tax=Limosilactobacillus reuteri TaxID=1598 RepID=UPI001E497B50|nr:sugar transferase [Limosilactobacillus reuteri]MCC4323965.1 sugar transferase [Limosilactobacillus reuteri]MCC4326805.1 sugar transferase [Limosilactobacillus reuteri]MCC4332989.1 sugar transferase [Limosilactobacillus reuteri]MCC4335066.1 sugar transferase [Limosilactobacillus reuteri]MCC4338588.1 sugar transferase [Limosilactobacillus reuteri]